MKPCQTLIKKKAAKKGREKETRGKDQSSGKQTAQKPLFGGPQAGNGTTKSISTGAQYVTQKQ